MRFALFAALLASGSALAGSAATVAGCSGGRQVTEMSCGTLGGGRDTRRVTVLRCGSTTFVGKYDAPGPTDAIVSVLNMPVNKILPRTSRYISYQGAQARGRSFNLTIDTKNSHNGSYVSVFEYGLPGADDKVQLTKFDMICRQPG